MSGTSFRVLPRRRSGHPAPPGGLTLCATLTSPATERLEPYAVSALLSRARSGLRTTYDLQTQSAQRLRNADIGKEASNGDSIPAI